MGLPKGPPVTDEQKDFLIGYMGDHLFFAKEEIDKLGGQGLHTFKLMWRSLAKDLNGIHGGVKKTPEKWKNEWKKMKNDARTALSTYNYKLKKTGNNSKPDPLDEFDDRICGIFNGFCIEETKCFEYGFDEPKKVMKSKKEVRSEQFRKMLKFIDVHPGMLVSFQKNQNRFDDQKEDWETLALVVNELGPPRKTASEWFDKFWEYFLRTKGNISNKVQLSKNEQLVANLIGGKNNNENNVIHKKNKKNNCEQDKNYCTSNQYIYKTTSNNNKYKKNNNYDEDVSIRHESDHDNKSDNSDLSDGDDLNGYDAGMNSNSNDDYDDGAEDVRFQRYQKKISNGVPSYEISDSDSSNASSHSQEQTTRHSNSQYISSQNSLHTTDHIQLSKIFNNSCSKPQSGNKRNIKEIDQSSSQHKKEEINYKKYKKPRTILEDFTSKVNNVTKTHQPRNNNLKPDQQSLATNSFLSSKISKSSQSRLKTQVPNDSASTSYEKSKKNLSNPRFTKITENYEPVLQISSEDVIKNNGNLKRNVFNPRLKKAQENSEPVETNKEITPVTLVSPSEEVQQKNDLGEDSKIEDYSPLDLSSKTEEDNDKEDDKISNYSGSISIEKSDSTMKIFLEQIKVQNNILKEIADNESTRNNILKEGLEKQEQVLNEGLKKIAEALKTPPTPTPAVLFVNAETSTLLDTTTSLPDPPLESIETDNQPLTDATNLDTLVEFLNIEKS